MNKKGAGWNFDNTYSRLPEHFFARVTPQPVQNPRLVRVNQALARILGLDPQYLLEPTSAEFFSGNRIIDGAECLAQVYAGHQFGNFVPRLGDGRAILLGEQIDPDGRRFDIQLKGSGRTPFSRRGDGRAALGPMMRELIIGEALHALGIPTTRALAVVTTGEEVFREKPLPGAIVVRVAASHIRIGTFEYFAARGDHQALKILADYVIARHYSQCVQTSEPYLELCRSFFERQAALVARWLEVGFVHGVMNTDNVALSGESIDFGPCAFIDTYAPETVFSSIDTGGRYAFGTQPSILQWNLARFVETMLFLLDKDEQTAVGKAQDLLREFGEQVRKFWLLGMRAKLGLLSEEPSDPELLEDLLACMRENHLDYTATFRAISYEIPEGSALLTDPDFKSWFDRWRERLTAERNFRAYTESLASMRRCNPACTARNYLVEEALQAGQERGDFSVMDELLGALSNPFDESADNSRYSAPPPETWRDYRTFCGT